MSSLFQRKRYIYHDESKFTIDEYEAYEDFFYGSAVPEPEIRRAFDKAWLHHIHNNPHHWQYWVLINDDPEEGIKCLEIPGEYIIEMICDWWSFSWKANNLKLIFDWYNNHKDYMKINEKSKNRIEYILNRISDELNKKESQYE